MRFLIAYGTPILEEQQHYEIEADSRELAVKEFLEDEPDNEYFDVYVQCDE